MTQNGEVRLTKIGTSPGSLQNVAVNLNLDAVGGDITGDFAIQIDFHDAVMPGPDTDQAELHVHFADSSFFFDVFSNDDPRGSEVHVWIGSEHGRTSVSGNSGTFMLGKSTTSIRLPIHNWPISARAGLSRPVTMS